MNTEERIDNALDDFQLLQNQTNKNQLMNEYFLQREGYSALMFQVELMNNSKRNDSNALKFKSSVNILQQLYKAFKTLLNESSNFERKAVYYQMKYEGVMQQESINENIMQNVNRLLTERDELQDKLKQYEN